MSYSTIALATFICILIGDMFWFASITGVYGNTNLVAALNLVSVTCLLVLSLKFSWKDKTPSNGLLVFVLFMAWGLFSFVRGALNAQDYWDWKILLLGYSFSISVPLAMVVGLNYKITAKTFRFILKLFLLGFVLIPFSRTTNYEFYARAMMAVSLLILFVPYLKYKWRVLIFVVAMISISMDFSYRANLLRVLMSAGLLSVFFGRHLIKVSTLNFATGVLFCLPLVFLHLGVSGKFNVFTENAFDYVVATGNDSNTAKADLSNDTRTFLYVEVLSSMLERDSSFMFGEGGGAAYRTYAFGTQTLNERGRYSSEVGFLNTLLYSGAIGVLLYSAVLFTAAYYAINHSNNYLCKTLALFLAGHWVLFFIEDITRLDLNFYLIWVAVGLCLSKQFRALTDVEIKQFLNSKSRPTHHKAYKYRSPRIFGQVQ